MIGIALLSSIATSLTVLMFWRILGPEGSLKKERHLRKRIVGSPSPENLDIPLTLEKTYYLSDGATLQKILSRYESSKKVAHLLKRAQLKIPVSVFILFCLTLGVFSFVVLRVYLGPFYSLVFALGIAPFPFLYLRSCNRRYLAKFAEYLPEALSLMSGALKTGFGLQAAVEVVAKNAPSPVSVEFQTVVSEMRLGQLLQTALQNMYQRIKSPEMKIFVTGVAIQQELGGNLSEILENLEKTIRARSALEREVKVLATEGILSYRILLVLPYVIAGMILTMSPSLVTDFFTSPWGRQAIFLILGLQLCAYLWMRKMVHLKE